CNWLSEKEGIPPYYPIDAKDWLEPFPDPRGKTGYRLPTETEWEYACRAGASTNRFYGSDDELLDRYAWYQKNADGFVQPVGLKMPNAFGLFDALGNSWDWCQDQKEPYPIKDEYALRPFNTDEERILRGGSFLRDRATLRSAFRFSLRPKDHS